MQVYLEKYSLTFPERIKSQREIYRGSFDAPDKNKKAQCTLSVDFSGFYPTKTFPFSVWKVFPCWPKRHHLQHKVRRAVFLKISQMGRRQQSVKEFDLKNPPKNPVYLKILSKNYKICFPFFTFLFPCFAHLFAFFALYLPSCIQHSKAQLG